MNNVFLSSRIRTLVCFMFVFILSAPVHASVTYTFVVSEQPSGDFHKPLFAQLVLSDAAVEAGKASNGQIESLVFGGGATMQETNRITLAYLHSAFYDLTVDLSADRKTVTAIAAKLRPSGSPIDNWVFHYQRPPHPTLDIHEFVGYIRHDSVSIETTILPVAPTTHFSRFAGQWQRTPGCWLCAYVCRPFYKFPFCWLDWIVVVAVVLVGFVIFRRLRRHK